MDLDAIADQLQSLATATGHFVSINQHEPKNAPGNGLVGALWLQTMNPMPRQSGLAATSVRAEWRFRVYQNALMQPHDAIEPRVRGAAVAVMTAYSANFTLGGLVREIVLTGSPALGLTAGYVTIDSKIYRIVDVAVPMIVDDAFPQEA